MKSNSLVLASASPRRSELLESAGIGFRVVPADICEDQLPDEDPVDHVLRLADGKARGAARLTGGRFFLGADTIVLCDGEIMGKPRDHADAERMLKKLSGVPHEVVTGFAIYDRERDGAVCSHGAKDRGFLHQRGRAAALRGGSRAQGDGRACRLEGGACR